MRRWRLGVPLLGFAAILALAFLTPRNIPMRCPSFARICTDARMLFGTPRPSLLVRFLFPAATTGAALVVLLASVRAAPVERVPLVIVAMVVLLGTAVALFLPNGTVPMPLHCSVLPHGMIYAGQTFCGVTGSHADPRLALRYIVLLGALVSAASLLLEFMFPGRRAPDRETRAAEPVNHFETSSRRNY